MNNGQEIRIGILCSGTAMPHWQAQCIRHLLDQPGIQVVALGIPEIADPRPGEHGMRNTLRTRIMALLCQDVAVREDLSEQLSNLPVVTILGDCPDARELHELEGHGASALLSLLPSWSTSTGPTRPVIWQFDINGAGLGADGLPLHSGWMMEAEPATVRLWATDGTEVSTTFGARTLNGRLDVRSMLLGSSWLPVQMCRSLQGQQGLRAANVTEQQHGNEGLLALIRQWLRLELRPDRDVHGREARIGEWNLGIYPHPISNLLAEVPNTNVRWLTSPSPGSQRVEPFGYRTADGQLNVLYRKSADLSSNDSIARVRPRNDGILKRSRPMLSTVHPLGYPFTLQRPDGIYVVISYPHQDRIELFRVAENNEGLDHIGTLLERALVNPTCVEHEGRWWLFGTDVDEPDGVLRAYHAPILHGPYQAHAMDPVRISGSGCRPAGTFFVHEGSLWRPSLDNTDPRAPAVIFNRILVLDPERFQEEATHTFTGFQGTSYPNGIRTVCALDGITMVDGLRPTQVGREVDIEERRTVRKAKAYTE